ncbi:unnamed protein product [Peronospora destructor]|uniref:subtilisin n=1 Tax=Peronospora destructor TaxID=86335 RepID=A0AAV0T9V4_9STRA|nr:unnamed protein product [Peronospora destructor]
MGFKTLRFGICGVSTDVASRRAIHQRVAVLCVVILISLLSALPLAHAAKGQSKRCQFYEKSFMLEYVVQLRNYNALETQEELVSRFISSVALDYSLEIAKRVNKEYKKLQLLGLDKHQHRSRKLQTVASNQTVNKPARKLFGLRKESALLVDELGVRELWERGHKGQGVKVGIFDTGLSSSQLTNVKERINWTHEPKNTDSVGHGTFVAGVISGTNAKCPGLAPEAELFVFCMFTDEHLSFTSWYLDAFNYALFKKIHVLNLSTGGPDFQDLPFIDKAQELIANGIILVSAVGNDGPHYGLLSNPADQVEELPFGSGRVKPDLVTLAEDVPGADARVDARWNLLNPASMKQILLESSDKLEARYGSDYVVRSHIFEQGSGALNISRASKIVKNLWTRHQTAKNATRMGQDIVLSVFKPSSFPDKLDITDCPRMWPYCLQPLDHSALPLMPYFGSIGVFVEVKEQAAVFEGIAQGTLRLELDNANHIDDILIPLTVKIIPTPPASKRILWDQFHNIPNPSAFVPRDNLENQRNFMDASGDHPHPNFRQMWNFLAIEDFFAEIMPFEYSCLDLGKYGVVLVVDPEEDFFRDEIVALQAAVKYSNVSLIGFADWYDDRMLDSLELFDTSTLSKWHAIIGGANIPAINELLQDFHIAFGSGVVRSSSVLLLDSGNDSSFPYWSGSYLTNFPVDGYLGYIDAVDQSARILNGSEKTLTDVPVLGLYEVPSRNGGRIAVFGDSSCLDSSVHPAAKFQNCFGMLHTILRFTNDDVLPFSSTLQDDSTSTELQRLKLEFVADESVLHPLVDVQDEDIWQLRARHSNFARHSKVLQVSKGKSIHRSYCNFYAKVQCVNAAP